MLPLITEKSSAVIRKMRTNNSTARIYVHWALGASNLSLNMQIYGIINDNLSCSPRNL